jgi:3-hydroxymyristoyl/3-hydroxydecanoyl-(acyl carrier protein) dehydratase/1-acyl-sn-glycerol-3-phosphate acyltransferase
VTLLECHATGTPVGDSTEVRSSASVFADARDLPIGSLKGNLGHLVTVAGAAAIIKILGAMEHGLRPPTLHADAPIDALTSTPFRLLHEAEPWSGRKLAGVSAFGFGGNNAHAVLESPESFDEHPRTLVSLAAPERVRPRAAVLAIAARAGEALTTEAVREALARRAPAAKPMPYVPIELDGLKFPPKDLEQTLAQQLTLLEACREVAREAALPRERTGVFVGMGCDPEVSRYGMRWRLLEWSHAAAVESSPWVNAARDAIIPKLEAAGVLGTMPNIPANRVNSQLDLGGAGFTISSEERSGLDALDAAIEAFSAGTLDVAIVGAVDLSCEPVHQEALRALGRDAQTGDVAVALLVASEAFARASAAPILGWVSAGASDDATLRAGDGEDSSAAVVFGRAHAAHGLFELAAALWQLSSSEHRACVVRCAPLEGPEALWTVHKGEAASRSARVATAFRHEVRRPAHPSAIVIPMPESTVTRMERAPSLPPINNAASSRPTIAATTNASSDPVPKQRSVEHMSVPHFARIEPETTASVEVLTVETAARAALEGAAPLEASDPISVALLTQARIAAVQAEFLTQQASVHCAFLQALLSDTPWLASPSASVATSQSVRIAAEEPSPASSMTVHTQPERRSSLTEDATAIPAETSAPLASQPSALASTSIASIAPAMTTVEAPSRLASAPSRDEKRAPALPGPKFSRAQLEVLAGGKISSIFGDRFQEQDRYHRQVRMPEPPLLLADRVTGIDATPLSMGTGTIWTETDVTQGAWYLTPEGRMPAGVMIEAGQADLLLISWLGVDMHNKGERVYRLLGCEGSWHGELPKPGDTLQYDIHVDGHANQGDVRLFFFHYDCRVNGELRLRVRNGQAGFFTDQELAESGGVLWSPDEEKADPRWRKDAPARELEKRSFSREEILAFANGRPWECFGERWAFTRAHVRTPAFGPERIVFQHRVTEVDPNGGPWGHGYLRAEQDVRPDDWYFNGHFKNDPCMPGTLMFEGCLQMMAFYLGAMGYTIERDAWRFEVTRGRSYPMRCRGQVIPSSKQVVYELFVKELIAEPEPTVIADILCTVDGLKAFHAKSVGLSLIPDWPLGQWEKLAPHAEQKTGALVPVSSLGGLEGWIEPKPVASVDGFAFDYRSLLACAWGAPSEAFGPIYARFDGPRRVARLPGPPYHFMSRITKVSDGEGGHGMGAMKVGTSVEVEYDLPEETWYLEQNGFRTMPFCVLMEAALQPCGWLASFVGSALTTDIDLLFRNLDGTGTLHEDILPENGTFTTRVRIDSISRSAGMIIESFTVECLQRGRVVFEMKTVFGFFPKEAFENQVGLPVSDAERARFNLPAHHVVELDREKPTKYFGGASLRLPRPMLLMIDRVVRYEPDGGAKGLGYARAEKDVDTSEWFFKAHFFQDPVQPGSLGIEAFVQLLQWTMIEKGIGADVPNGRFEPIMTGRPVTWKYRGQVVPKNKLITSEVEIIEVGRDDKGPYAVADCALWVDAKKIYHAKGLAIRVVSGPATRATKGSSHDEERDSRASERTLSLSSDPWLGDHRPTWTIPALPMMSVADMLADEASRATGKTIVSLRDLQMKRWITVPDGESIRYRVQTEGDDRERRATLSVWRDATDPRLSRFEPTATATVLLADTYAPPPAPFEPLADTSDEEDPYESGALFHGPSFRAVTRLRMGTSGATAELDLTRCTVPYGALHQGVLDALTHAIPHESLHRWSSALSSELVAYPYRLDQLDLFRALPREGHARIEARLASVDREQRLVTIDLQLIIDNAVAVSARLTEILLPKGPIGVVPRAHRLAFLRDRRFVPGVSLSREHDGVTVLDRVEAAASDWLPNNLATIYRVGPSQRGVLFTEIAAKEHCSRRAFVHPSRITVHEGDSPEPQLAPFATVATHHAIADVRPLRAHPLLVQDDGTHIQVRDARPSMLDLSPVRRYWDRWFGIGPWFGEDLHYGLIKKFVGDVVIADPAAFEAIRGRSCLFLGNHQVGVESLLFSVLAAGLTDKPVVTLAKAEHRDSWLGHFIRHVFTHPGIKDPQLITFFEREDRSALLEIVGQLGAELASGTRSVMVHVEGTRALTCRAPVIKMSSAFIDMALTVRVPIVPVRFVGGLPSDPPLEARLEFPVGYGRQDYWFGRPITPEELEALSYKDRKALVIAAINGLGPGSEREEPYPGDPEFERVVRTWSERSGASLEHSAILAATLAYARSSTTEALARALREGRYEPEAGPFGQWMRPWARWFFGDGSRP